MGRRKKDEIANVEYDVPFLTPCNMDYVKKLDVKVKDIEGKTEHLYYTN